MHTMSCCCAFVLFFFFKQKTAYEMRISDWSSDVCSSDLLGGGAQVTKPGADLAEAEPWLGAIGKLADQVLQHLHGGLAIALVEQGEGHLHRVLADTGLLQQRIAQGIDRKSTRLNSSH